MRTTTPDFLVIGHICHDKVSGGYVPGGAAAYAGLLGARLGFHTAALTSFGEDFLFASQFEGISVKKIPASGTTIFENIYTGGNRIQYLHQKAADLSPLHLEETWRHSKTVLLGPICDEVSFDFIDAFENAVICACPQGWMRQWDKAKRVFPKMIGNWDRICSADIISMSETDVAGDWDLIEEIAKMSNILLVTQGQKGAMVYHEKDWMHYPAFPVTEIDPTGAGDIFAAAFTLCYSGAKNVSRAVAFAHAAASLSVEGKGMASIPGRFAVEERYRRYCEMAEIESG